MSFLNYVVKGMNEQTWSYQFKNTSLSDETWKIERGSKPDEIQIVPFGTRFFFDSTEISTLVYASTVHPKRKKSLKSMRIC
jgi:hypothetical protein